MRPARLLAVARRDLLLELGGRRGWVMPAVLAGLLLPASAVPPLRAPQVDAEAPPLLVTGDVPDEVLALPRVVRVDGGARVRFERVGDTLVVRGPVDPSIRRALDGDAPAVRLQRVAAAPPLPGRGLLLALISASTLTSAVATSLAGERSARTLTTLLTASISRSELIFGKWFAWSGFGAAASLLAAFVASALGHVEPGAWMLPMASVPAGTVALGLWLSRRASDVVGGATIALRVLPAALSLLGVVAWFVGWERPWVGALVPLGGALLTAGSTWPGLLPPLLATASTLALSVAAVRHTARDLEETAGERPPGRPLGALATAGALAAAAWWIPLQAPLLYAMAGNPVYIEGLPLERGLVAGAFGLLLLSVARAARSPEPVAELAAGRPGLGGLLAGAALGLLLGWIAPGDAVGAAPADAAARFAATLVPAWASPASALLVALADELLFRGWLPRIAGPVGALAVWGIVRSPFDPLVGLAYGAVLLLLVRRTGSVWPAVLARFLHAL